MRRLRGGQRSSRSAPRPRCAWMPRTPAITQLGPITQDYPDLVLAAVVGGILAGRALQRPAAVLVAILSAAYTALLTIADTLPATVPLTLALVLLELGPGLHDSRRGIRSRPGVAVAVGPRLALRARPLAEYSPRSSRPRKLPFGRHGEEPPRGQRQTGARIGPWTAPAKHARGAT